MIFLTYSQVLEAFVLVWKRLVIDVLEAVR